MRRTGVGEHLTVNRMPASMPIDTHEHSHIRALNHSTVREVVKRAATIKNIDRACACGEMTHYLYGGVDRTAAKHMLAM